MSAPPAPPPLQSQTTLELKEEDLEESTPVAPPPLRSQTTLELKDEDLEESTPLAPVSTQELEDADLEEVPEPPAPPPAAKMSLERRPDGVRVLSGRIAYPIAARTDHTPISTMPKEVNETAVAGLPPQPPRSDEPLSSQIMSLTEIRQRRDRRRWERVMWGATGVILFGAVIGGTWHLASGPEKRQAEVVATLPATDGAALDGTALARVLAPPADTSSADLHRFDLGPPADQGEPDQRTPDQSTSRPVPRHRPHVGEQQTRKEPRPSRRPGFDRGARAGLARQSYQEGLRLLFRGQAEVAIRRFNRALKQDPSLHIAFRGLGLAYEKVGRKEMATEAFRRYLILSPSAPDAAAIRARIKALTR